MTKQIYTTKNDWPVKKGQRPVGEEDFHEKFKRLEEDLKQVVEDRPLTDSQIIRILLKRVAILEKTVSELLVWYNQINRIAKEQAEKEKSPTTKKAEQALQDAIRDGDLKVVEEKARKESDKIKEKREKVMALRKEMEDDPDEELKNTITEMKKTDDFIEYLEENQTKQP